MTGANIIQTVLMAQHMFAQYGIELREMAMQPEAFSALANHVAGTDEVEWVVVTGPKDRETRVRRRVGAA